MDGWMDLSKYKPIWQSHAFLFNPVISASKYLRKAGICYVWGQKRDRRRQILMCLHNAARTIKKLKSQNDIQWDCAGNRWLEEMKEKEESINISTIFHFLNFSTILTVLSSFHFFLFFCTACTSLGCSFIQVSHLSTFHWSAFLTPALNWYVKVL